MVAQTVISLKEGSTMHAAVEFTADTAYIRVYMGSTAGQPLYSGALPLKVLDEMRKSATLPRKALDELRKSTVREQQDVGEQTAGPASKCIVAGCENRQDMGLFIGALCCSCHTTLVDGGTDNSPFGTTFIHRLVDRVAQYEREQWHERAEQLLKEACGNADLPFALHPAARSAVLKAIVKALQLGGKR